MRKIIVTGGCGYIGAHTIVDLIQNGYDVVSIDDNSRSNPEVLDRIKTITGKSVKNYQINLVDELATVAVFKENADAIGIIHFAAFKSVEESVNNPLMYFDNNLKSLINVLKCAKDFDILNFVFSSSCTVYGNPDEQKVTEETEMGKAGSPYGASKQISEQIIQEFAPSFPQMKSVLLRYFNPVGAHPSLLIGEIPLGKPANLFPAITQTAIGKLDKMIVHGNDYDTRDGSCVRDYIHVSDIAHAHTLALQFLEQGDLKINPEILNLGTGTGFTVLEVIDCFQKTNNVQLNFSIGPRRAGDVVAIYANNEKAQKLLNWHPKYDLKDMVKTAWEWEKKLAE